VKIVESYNPLNESSLTFVSAPRVAHASVQAFREASIFRTFEGWESPQTLRRHLAMPMRPYRIPELRIMVQKLLKSTPCDAPDLNHIEECFRVQNAWNAVEILWTKSDCFCHLIWGTSA